MGLNRRDMLKLAGLAAAGAAVSGCNTKSGTSVKEVAEAAIPMLKGPSAGKRVVVVGGGFGGLAIAKELRGKSKDLEVIVLEKKDIFMSCPFSSAYLGGIEGVSLRNLIHDFYEPASAHGYDLVQCTVTGIDRKLKLVHTTKGGINYDILVLSPGIAYDFKGQFPEWSDEKIAHVQQMCPGALMPGSEHLALKRQLENMDDGDVLITAPTSSKYRCPPAPFERACMVATYMKNEGIEGKVFILNETESVAKGAAFKEAWKELYGDRIIHMTNCKVTDIDPAKKVIYFDQTVFKDADDIDGTVSKKEHKYEVLNFIPHNIASPMIKHAGLKTNGWGGAMMEGSSFRSVSDEHVYVIGDCVGHGLPPSGQSAVWAAKEAATEIVSQLMQGKKTDSATNHKLPYRAGNVCYSMVAGGPDEAIMVTHDFMVDPNSGNLKSKGHVPHPPDGNGKFRSGGIGKATREWHAGIMRELFS